MIGLQKSYEKNRSINKKKKKSGLFGLLGKAESDEEDDEPDDFNGLKKKFEKAKFQEYMDQVKTERNKRGEVRLLCKNYVFF